MRRPAEYFTLVYAGSWSEEYGRQHAITLCLPERACGHSQTAHDGWRQRIRAEQVLFVHLWICIDVQQNLAPCFLSCWRSALHIFAQASWPTVGTWLYE